MLAPEVSTNFFQTLGVLPTMGRPFHEGDDAPGAGAAIVSNEFWQNSMHAANTALGSKLKVNGQLYTVVGVMPPRFPVSRHQRGRRYGQHSNSLRKKRTKQGFGGMHVLGRMRPGATAEQARAGRRGVPTKQEAHIQFDCSETFLGVSLPAAYITGARSPDCSAPLAACIVLLLIAVVNTANLQIRAGHGAAK